MGGGRDLGNTLPPLMEETDDEKLAFLPDDLGNTLLQSGATLPPLMASNNVKRPFLPDATKEDIASITTDIAQVNLDRWHRPRPVDLNHWHKPGDVTLVDQSDKPQGDVVADQSYDSWRNGTWGQGTPGR